MTRHSLLTYKLLVGSILSALLLAPSAPAFAEDSGLFPTKNKISHTPDYLPDLAPANGMVESAPSQGPLRVVIPNIHSAKPAAANHVQKAEPKIADAVITPSPRTAANDASVTNTIVPPAGNTTASALDQISRALFAKAQEAWSNGVFLAEWSKAGIIKTILKPNITFSSIPTDWRLTVTASNDPSMVANLSPAAGGDPAKIDAPAQPLIPTVIRTPDAAAAPAPIQPDTQVMVPATTAPANAADASEPAPSLSSQSKNIAGKIPAVRDVEPEKPLTKKVDIDRKKDVAADVLTSAKPTAVAAPANANIKPGDRPRPDVNYELQRAYDALIAGKSEDAIHIYEDILTGNPKNKDALFGLASTYHRAGQIDMARTLYGKLLAIDPKNRDGLNNFLVLLADEAPEQALTQMQKLEDQNPDFSPIPAQMAIIYQKLGDTDKAVDKMYRALTIAPENITYRYNLAIMLDKSGKYDQAGKLYTQILDSHAKGEVIPGDPTKIQQRLTFIRSNTLK